MSDSFPRSKAHSNAGRLLDDARHLSTNAAELIRRAQAARDHIASIRTQIENMRNTSAQISGSQARPGERVDVAIGSEAASPVQNLGQDLGGRAFISAVLVVALVGIVSHVVRR